MGLSGTIKSPNYPNNYGDNLYCEWLIRVEDYYRVQMRFIDFSLEKLEYVPGCLQDSVTVCWQFK